MGLAIAVDHAHWYGLIVGLFIYGVYLMVFGLTVYLLSLREIRSKVVLAALCALFLLSTGYYILATYDIYLAFIPLREDPGTVAHLLDWADPLPPAKDIMYIFSLGVADALLIWRLYVIWPENVWTFRFVAVLWTGLFVIGIGVFVNEIRQAVKNSPHYVQVVSRWTVGGSAIILVTNLTVTGMITWRLLWMSRQVTLFGTSASKVYHSIIFVMIQNGSIYCSCVVMQLIVFAAQIEGAVYVFLHISPAVVALFPTAIVLQLHLPGACPGHFPEAVTQWDTTGISTDFRFAARRTHAGHAVEQSGRLSTLTEVASQITLTESQPDSDLGEIELQSRRRRGAET